MGSAKGSARDELPVEIDHAKEPLKQRVVGGCREAGDGGDILAEGRGARAGDRVSLVLNLRSSKGTHLQVDSEALKAVEVEHTVEMLLMRGQGVGKNPNIFKVDETKQKISKDLVHHSLEGLGSIPEANRKAEKLKSPKGVMMAVFGILAGLIGIWK